MTMEDPSGNAPESVIRLLRSLAAGTTEGRVNWQQTGPLKYTFTGPVGWVLAQTDPAEDAPVTFSIYDNENTRLEVYQAPTRFSEAILDNALIALWRAIVAQHRGETIEPIIASLIEAAGGEVQPRSEPLFDSSDDLDDLPF